MNPMKDAHTKFEFARPEAIRAKNRFSKKKQKKTQGRRHASADSFTATTFRVFLVFLFISVKIPGKKRHILSCQFVMLLLLLNVAFHFHLYNGQLHVQLYVHDLHVGVDSGLKEQSQIY